MNLPNYFFADLPPGAELNPTMIREAGAVLRRNREQYLAVRSTQSIVKLLANVAENWRHPDYPFRKLALEHGPKATGFSQATLVAGLDGFFRQLTEENFYTLLVQELGNAQRLDEFGGSPEAPRQRARAGGPELLVHFAAGNVPNPTLLSMVTGVLLRAAQFVKCARGAAFLPRLFAHSLYDTDHKLGACLEIAEWRGGHAALEDELFTTADAVTVTGSDEAVAAIRKRLPGRVRFAGYGHRVSFGYVSSGALGFAVSKIVAAAATDIVAWNQLGCLSPHVIYVEHGGGVSPERFAEMLAEELAQRETTEPRGELPSELAATIASRRAFYEVRAAHSPETRLWRSDNSTAWTVVFEADALFQASCLNRFVYVKSTENLVHTLQSADAVCGKVSTVGLAAPEDKAAEMAAQLARWGVTRVCPLGQMQNPPLTWRHDGRPVLGELITWTDWER